MRLLLDAMSKPPTGSRCYACGVQTDLSWEHAPPTSWFSSPNSTSLIAVPACKAHNEDNSGGVEWVRDILAAMHDPKSPDGLTRGGESAKKQGLGHLTELEVQQKPETVRGIAVRTSGVPAQTIHEIFRAIGDALRFHLTDEPLQTTWKVYAPGLESSVPDAAKRMVETMLAGTRWQSQHIAFPEEFAWSTASYEGQEMYRLTFLKQLDVFLISPPTVDTEAAHD